MPVDEQTARSIYRAYIGGQMEPDEAAAYAADVEAGIMSLPQGAQLLPPSDVPFDVMAEELDPGVIEAYRAGRMTPEEESALAADVVGGRVKFPRAPAEGPGVGDIAAGTGEALLTTATGATGGTLGMIGGALKGLASEILSGEFGTPSAAKRIERSAAEGMQAFTYMPRTETGQEILETVGEIAAPLAGAAPLAETAALAKAATRAPAVVAPRAAARATARRATEAAQKAVAGPEGRRVIEARPETGRLAVVADAIKRDPYDADVAEFRLVGQAAVKDRAAGEAIKQGFEPGVVAAIKASTPKDIKRMIGMLNIHKMGRKSATFKAKNRPADMVGKTVAERVKFLASENKKAGNEISAAANTLRGREANIRPAMDRFLADLDDIGVTIEPKKKGGLKAVLRGSDVEGDNASKAILNRVLSRLGDTDAPDAYGVHRAKQYLDTQVAFGRRAKTPLSAKTERIVKDLRRNLNEALREMSPEYKAANEKFSATRGALDDFRKAVGASVDIDSPNIDKALGQSSRKLLSNYQTRVQLTDALDNLEGVAKAYGKAADDNVLNQLIVANEIDRMFGAAAPTSLKGQVAEAMQTGVEAARSSLAENALGLARAAASRARGINEENAIKALEELLKRESGE